MAGSTGIIRILEGTEEDIRHGELWAKSTRLSDILFWRDRATAEGHSIAGIASVYGSTEDLPAKFNATERARLFALFISKKRGGKK